jgi:hypothetical protein
MSNPPFICFAPGNFGAAIGDQSVDQSHVSAQLAALTMFARGVSRGMKMCASIPALAAYAARAPTGITRAGTASLVAPRYFAIETAALIPTCLEALCRIERLVFNPELDIISELSAARSSGVPPSPNETAQHLGQRQHFAITPQ